MPESADLSHVISTIVKHDNKVTSYKIALLRAINDVVLSFPDLRNASCDVAIPLRVLAEFWLAYYWPFVDPAIPIMQGRKSVRDGMLRNDMAFRTELTDFRSIWQETWKGLSNPADGYFIINELRISRRRAQYSNEIITAYQKAQRKIAQTIEMPIRYAGPGEWTVFAKPKPFQKLQGVVGLPGTQPDDECVVITESLWHTFRRLSLWVEALCIHEWSLFTERVDQVPGITIDRGIAYTLLTARPDNRRPLTWERNHIDVLLMEGHEFICPWTERRITYKVSYDLDHIVPVSVYPINELWNLVPSDPNFNSHTKRDRLPSSGKLLEAKPHLLRTYNNYGYSEQLARAIQEDVALRFVTVRGREFAAEVTDAVVDFVVSLTESRNLAQF